MRPMDARSRKNGCPVRCHKALKTMGSRLDAVVHTCTAKSSILSGGIDVGQGLTSTCGDLERSSMEAGSIFYPAHVYITDARNQQQSDEKINVMQYEAGMAENPVNITSGRQMHLHLWKES